MDKGRKTIGYTEWGLFLGALLLIDLVQTGLELLYGVGLFIGPFIDFIVGCALLLYCKLRGITLSKERLMSIGAAFLFNATPLQGGWIVDGLYIMGSVKAQEAVDRFGGMLGPIGGIVQIAAKKYAGKQL